MSFLRQARLGRVLFALVVFLLVAWRPVLAQDESTEAGNRQYLAAAALQRGDQFELAVAAWNNFLANNKDHAFVPQATLNLGVCYLKSKQYDKALATLQQFLQKYPDSSFREAAYLHLGVTQFSLGRAGQRQQYIEATRTLDTLLRRYPKGKYLAQALYYRAECDYALGKKETAAKMYDRLIREFPDGSLLPVALYALGVTQEELGQFRAAGATYDQFLATSPNHSLATEVAMRRGETLFGTGQYRAAIGWFARAANSKGFTLADHATVREAACLAQLKDYANAAELYASVVEKFPKSTHIEAANLAAGKCYYLADLWDKSLDVLTKVISARGPSLPEATHWCARSLLKHNKPTEAVSLLEQTLSEAGGSPWEAQLRLDLADATYEIPKLRPISVSLYADVVKKFPEDPVADSALYMAAFAALQQNDFKTAVAHAEQFFETYSASELLPDVVAIAAESDLQLNRLDEAQRRYQDLVDRYPNHPEVPSWRLRRGLILHMQNEYAQAIGALRPIINRLHDKTALAEAYYLMGSSLLQQHQYDQAIEALRSSVLADANWRAADDTLLVLADALRQKGDSRQAIETIRHLITTFPKSPLLDQAHFWLAEIAYGDGDMPTAIHEYQDMISTWPKSSLVPHALFGLGWAQLSQNDYVAAERTFDRFVADFPKDDLAAQARFARGTARQQLGKFAPAIEDVQALLATDPSGKEKSDALYVLGLCQAGLKQNDKATATFETLLEQDPEYTGSDKVFYELGWVLKASGKDEEAVDRFVELAKQYPNSPLAAESLYHAGEVLYARRQYDDAARVYRDVADTTTDPFLKEKAFHKLGWSYFNQDRFDKARATFAVQRTAVPDGKLVADAAFMEGECLTKSGKHREALAAYERMLAAPQKPLGNDFETLARLHAAQAAGQLNQWDKSLKLLLEAAQNAPQSDYLPEILFEQGRAQQNLGKLNQAARLYTAVVGKTNREVAARAQFMLGELLFQQKKYAEAIRTFYEVIYGGYDAPQWQADATYEAARCFEVLKKTDQAAKLYRELLKKYPKSDKAPSAKTRLDSLEK
ncbi:MAG: tetratricopeptide repeat protein [Pirellulales bacterium]|nr:tetratricopeptide repeat protein [Pirellulales bacterium]